MLSRGRDLSFDLEGGNRIPKISERKARSVAELRAAGVGVRRVLLVHDASAVGSDLFQAVLTMLDDDVVLDFAVLGNGASHASGVDFVQHDLQQASRVGREIGIHHLSQSPVEGLLQLVREHGFDLLIVPAADEPETNVDLSSGAIRELLQRAACPLFLAARQRAPQAVIES